ncbi:amino acid ABC transporter permease [Pseudomonas sp. GX19020]|uniref:amino acid ABC transporter permease n=1 Tax=Pseudomonas sp. GX19020 TaxID=2942277 RepID=UPI002019BCEC|nr:amino acid ABC transporter permease [Pseudomonas sp. GX19020]MCL4068091.1 amino acid ABC transporter permease [Pseudomonas sp. GX19020]
MGYQFDFTVIWKSWPLLLEGALNTMYYTVVSILIAMVLGTLVMLGRKSKVAVIRILSRVFIESLRNTPFLVQLFFVYFGLPSLGIKLSIETAAIAALSLNTAAYIAEVVRGGVDALPKGQIEAGRALGLNGRQIFFDVVLKPSLRAVYPGLCSQFILLLLMTSIVSSISAPDLTYQALFIESRYFRSFEAFFTVTAIYLFLSVTLSSLLRVIGRFYFSYPTR